MKIAVTLATFGFIFIVLFITISPQMGTIFSMITEQSSKHGVSSDVNPFINMMRFVLGFIFAASFLGLIIWAFLGSHEEEYEEY